MLKKERVPKDIEFMIEADFVDCTIKSGCLLVDIVQVSPLFFTFPYLSL